jgi:phage terminase large subunit
MTTEIIWKLSKKQEQHIYDKSRKLLIEGSAGSGKTLFAVHKTLLYALTHRNARIGVFRDTLTALKVTSLLELRTCLIQYNIPFKENKSEHIITFPNGTTILFRGLDDLKKIRSHNLDFIWIEQAEEVSWMTFAEVEKRLRGVISKRFYGQLLLTVTPEQKTHWIYDYFHRKNKGTTVHFHYTDNPFLPQAYLDEYEEMKELDYELYVKYTLGLWGKLSNIVYSKWDEKPISIIKKWTGGVDWGFNDPNVFLLIGWYDGEPFIDKEIYIRHKTTAEFLVLIKDLLTGRGLEPSDLEAVYCDSSEPDRIKEFKQAGFNALPGTKKFTERLDKVKTVMVHINPECVNTKMEIQSYKYAKDRDGNIEEKPVDKFNHAMDAMGYCVYGELGGLTGNPFSTSPKRNDFAEPKGFHERQKHKRGFHR